jgi:hypothetical protein
MNNPQETCGASTRSGPKLFAIVVVIAVLAFLGGLVPMWLHARNTRDELREAAQRLTLGQIEISLGAAAIDARRGDYEAARREASQFFTSLQEEVNRGAQSALNSVQREKAAALFSQRDALITLLARSDPASADRLSDLYVASRAAIQGQEGATSAGTNQPAH